jgi:SAM-dependent methyltransferase
VVISGATSSLENMSTEKIPIAQDSAEVRARHRSNREAWNEAAEHYTRTLENALAFLRAGKSNLHPIERANLGNLREWCGTAIHLQCASGKDTLSLWNEGVQRVVGVDISDVMLSNARKLTEALGAPATWYVCDVLDTPAELDGTADLVFTGRGALYWLHDIKAWAKVVARLLKPGGILHAFDDHPFSLVFDPDATTLIATKSYSANSELSRGWDATYITEEDLGKKTREMAKKYSRAWTLSELFGALRAAGLTVEHLGEHVEDYYDGFPNLAPAQRELIPRTFSLIARRSC